jgi:hypothetical protein
MVDFGSECVNTAFSSSPVGMSSHVQVTMNMGHVSVANLNFSFDFFYAHAKNYFYLGTLDTITKLHRWIGFTMQMKSQPLLSVTGSIHEPMMFHLRVSNIVHSTLISCAVLP